MAFKCDRGALQPLQERRVAVPHNSEERPVTCPVCLANPGKSVGAQGMVVTAALAIVTGEYDQIKAAAENSEPYDFHMAVTMYVEALVHIGETLGYSVEDMLLDLRKQLDKASARDS